MTFGYMSAFALAMFLWAAMPGPGLAVVVSRALMSGRKAGFAVIAGLIAADLIFMVVAVIGLMAFAETMGPMFLIVKYAGAGYLIWRGYRLLVDREKPTRVATEANGSALRDVGLGLVVTLGNPKSILFFGALLPAFVDMTTISFTDFLVLAVLVTCVSFFVYGGYMMLADRARGLMSSAKAVKRLKQATGTLLVGSGILVATR